MSFLCALGLASSGCLASSLRTEPLERPTGLDFETHQLDTGRATRQTVLVGSFLGDGVEQLAVLEREADGHRVRVFSLLADGWAPRAEATLEPGTLFVDQVEIAGRDRLMSYAAGRLTWLDLETGDQRPLAVFETAFRSDLQGGPPRRDVTRDLNGDGRDDIVVPDVEGFWIATQLDDGSFTEATHLGPPEPYRDRSVGHLDVDTAGLGPQARYGDVGVNPLTASWYDSRVHSLDVDGDGRLDLAFWNEDHFDVYRQGEDGRFDPEAERFTVEVSFDSDGVYSSVFAYRDQGVLSAVLGWGKRIRQSVLHSFRDLDGDGTVDLVILRLEGRSLVRQRGVFEIYRGRATEQGLRFDPAVSAAIRPRSKALGMQAWGYSSQRFEDFDGDGRDDLMLRDVRVGPGGMFRALVGNSVSLDLTFYSFRDGALVEEPVARRKVRRFAPFAGVGNVFFPPVLAGDVNGDGRADLLVGESPRAMRVFLGTPESHLLAPEAHRVEVALPADERNTWLADLDGDGRQDLVVQLGPTARRPDAKTRLITLIAR